MILKVLSDIVGEKSFWDKYGNAVILCAGIMLLVFAIGLWYFAPNIKDSSILAKQRRINRHSYSVVADGYQYCIASGNTISPPSPSKSGFVFSGWFLDSALTVPWLSNQPVTSDMTLYPKWSKE